MSLFDFLKPPLFPAPDSFYQPLADFPAGDETRLRADIDRAIAQLSQRAKDFSSSQDFVKRHIDLMGQAENHAHHKEWGEAHRAIWEATFFLNRALESRAASKFRKCMVLYYAVWLLLLMWAGNWLRELEGGDGPGMFLGAAYWRYGFMGALGGLTIAIWGLTIHSVGLDFDRAFSIWYWLKPVLGAIMGLVAVLAVLAGLFAVQGVPDIKSRTALYVLAFLVGFSERFFVRILDRVMTSFFGGEVSVAQPAQPGRAAGKPRTANPGGGADQ